MNREEVIKGLEFTISMFLLDPSTGKILKEPRNKSEKITIDACKCAIQLLKQESTLNKVREEIGQITDTMGVSYNQYLSKIDVLDIIDKYIKESEVQNKNDEEHLVKTNAEKFLEDFGMKCLPFYSCIDTNAKCEECDYWDGIECDVDDKFWSADYKEPKKK